MPSTSAGYNPNLPSVKRILQEARELELEPSDQFRAAPLEDNLFEWHFTVRGPDATPFEGGRYHGRMLMPSEYPFKPPTIMILTPNGRFEVRKRICLSISDFHPEQWQPAWGIRTALTALIAFFPTPTDGAIGSLDYTSEERVKLAARSISWLCDACGDCMRTPLGRPQPARPASPGACGECSAAAGALEAARDDGVAGCASEDSATLAAAAQSTPGVDDASAAPASPAAAPTAAPAMPRPAAEEAPHVPARATQVRASPTLAAHQPLDAFLQRLVPALVAAILALLLRKALS